MWEEQLKIVLSTSGELYYVYRDNSSSSLPYILFPFGASSATAIEIYLGNSIFQVLVSKEVKYEKLKHFWTGNDYIKFLKLE